MALNPGDFEYISKIVREQSAIVLEKGKEYLVEARLTPLAASENFKTIADLAQQMKRDASGKLITKVVEAMTTNETSFFRDIHPFEVLKSTIIPELIQKRESQKKLSIWCGASSSGQEPYTLAMLIRENFPQLKNWKIDFMASDISTEIQKKMSGRYLQPVGNQQRIACNTDGQIFPTKWRAMANQARTPTND